MTRINPMGADYGDLWSNGYMPRHAEIQPHATGPACCGMWILVPVKPR